MLSKNGPDISISASIKYKDQSYAYVNFRFHVKQILMLSLMQRIPNSRA